ncbi:SDR family oxidoreductase [Bacteroides sp.]
MRKRRTAIITGADGGMGMEITRAVADAGYHVIMACYSAERANPKRLVLLEERAERSLEVLAIDLSSMASVNAFAEQVLQRKEDIALLMNNAGTMETGLHITTDGWERTVSVNYLGHYLLTRKLLPLMAAGSRVVNMVSCTYAIGRLDFPDFFLRGRKGEFWRIPIYSNTKLALLLFTFELAERVRESGITVNAADPGIVSTNIIRMKQWFDPLTDLFFRPFIRTPRQGASTAIGLLLDSKAEGQTGTFNLNNHSKKLSDKYSRHCQRLSLWEETEKLLTKWL